MILSDRDIKDYINNKRIVIEPALTKEQLQPAWVDLTLGKEFRIFKHTQSGYIDSKGDGEYTEIISVEEGKPLILHPGEFVLGSVNEYVKLPDDLAGAVDGRSSLGRMGIVVHLTSTFVNPGWGGKLVLEITNVGKMPVAIYPDMRVCKLVFFKLSSPSELPYDKRPDAKYHEQKGVEASKLHKDFEEK